MDKTHLVMRPVLGSLSNVSFESTILTVLLFLTWYSWESETWNEGGFYDDQFEQVRVVALMSVVHMRPTISGLSRNLRALV